MYQVYHNTTETVAYTTEVYLSGIPYTDIPSICSIQTVLISKNIRPIIIWIPGDSRDSWDSKISIPRFQGFLELKSCTDGTGTRNYRKTYVFDGPGISISIEYLQQTAVIPGIRILPTHMYISQHLTRYSSKWYILRLSPDIHNKTIFVGIPIIFCILFLFFQSSRDSPDSHFLTYNMNLTLFVIINLSLLIFCTQIQFSQAFSFIQGKFKRISYHSVIYSRRNNKIVVENSSPQFLVGENLPEEVAGNSCIYDMILVERLSAPLTTSSGILLPLIEGKDQKHLGKVLSIGKGYGLESEQGRLQGIDEIAPYCVGDIVYIRVS